MTDNILTRLFKHNNWTNYLIIKACAGLTDEQLDAEPLSATAGTIRETLRHLVSSQQGYLSRLTNAEGRYSWETFPGFAELEEGALATGAGLLELTKDEAGKLPGEQLRTGDGYRVEPWVIMVQIINHATEHREQIKSMLSALGQTPPEIDGWDYGYAVGALIPPEAS